MNAGKRVRLGVRSIREQELLSEASRVQNRIEKWASERGLWHDSSFAVPFVYHNEAPRSHETLLLISEGPLARVFDLDHAYAEFESSFNSLLESLGYSYESANHYSFSFYPLDDTVREDFLSLHRWEWLQHLLEKKMISLHGEVFEHFAKHPEDLKRTGWRQFEELLDVIFKNQGFLTELGPGSNDGGVDLRLYQNRAIPELVTLVQAKRYSSPIKLEAVAALFGIAAQERAPRAIFATTSYFQPKARKFALSTESEINLPRLEMADSSRIAGWCSEISETLDAYFAKGLSAPPAISEQTGPLAGSIVVAQGGYNCTTNFFAKVEADFPHEMILRPIGEEIVSGDFTSGTVIPVESSHVHWTQESRLLGLKTEHGIWAKRKYFHVWDGKPQYFNSD